MKTRAAVLWEREKDWSVEEIELDPPKSGEVLVSMRGSGLCHSDEHVLTGDLPWPLPMIGGHEGAGAIEDVGPGVTGLAPGDRVIFSFLPVCGRCRSCAQGMRTCASWACTSAPARRSPTTRRVTTPAARTSA